MCVMIFIQILSETLLTLRITEQETVVNVHRSSCHVEFSRQIVEKYSNINFHQNPSSGSRAVPCGRTDRHDATNSRLSQFCQGA
jgi:hypothetical protein